MNARLNLGQYYGSVVRRAQFGAVLVTETRHPAHAYLPMHAHRTAYFCFVQDGHYRETYGRRARECGPLTLAFHPPEESHSERIGAESVRSLNTEVSLPWLQHVQEAVPHFRDAIDARGGNPAWLATRLYREFRQPDRASSLVIEGLVLELAAELARMADLPSDVPQWLRRLHDRLSDEVGAQPTLSDLAREAGVHAMHVAASFRKHFGCSVGEFLRTRRVERAADLLRRCGLSLAEVALRSGFSDQSHLTRLFKRTTGMTPAAYRKTVS